MTDKEMLELAAKAAGYKAVFTDLGDAAPYGEIEHTGGTWKSFNPLTEEGDRHNLLIAIKGTLAHEPCRGGWSVGAVVGGEFKWLAFDTDDAMAIVRAAAEVGRAMK